MELEVVSEDLRQRRQVVPGFDEDPRFTPDWWILGSADSPVSFCRFIVDRQEVGRAKILPGAGTYADYASWSPALGGATEIDRLEIRVDLRRTGYRFGTQAVELICQVYGTPIAAMSLDQKTDSFWRKQGWTEHHHPEDDGRRFRRLFTRE